ncbi:MAG: PAS domain-containing protein [Candidatus Sumerlaeaceae bacterium]
MTNDTQELPDALATMQATIECARDGILVVDSNQRIACWNSQFVQMWRLPVELVQKEHNADLLQYAVQQLCRPDEYLAQTQEIYNSCPSESFDLVEFKDGRIYERVSKMQMVKGKYGGRVWSYRDVTERRIAEEALQKSERYNLSIMESSRDCIKVISLQGDLLWMSNSGRRKLCIEDPHEVLGKSWIGFWSARDQPMVRQAVKDAAAGGVGTFTAVFPVQGVERIWDIVITPILDSSGQPYQLLAVSRDVTEENKTVQALEQSEALLRTVTNEAGVGLVVLDSSRRYLFVNAAYAEILRLPTPDIIGRRVEDVLGDLYEQVRPHLDCAFSGVPVHYELQVPAPTPKETSRFYEVTYDPRKGEDGTPHILVLLVDVTTRKQAEQALQRREQELQALADSIPQLAWMAEPDGHIFWYNHGWYEYTGTTLEQMEGWGWQSVHDPEILPKVLLQWKASIATGHRFEMEFPLRGSDGTFRWFLTRVNPLRDEAGRIVRWFGTNTDIDQVKKVREALSEERRVLEVLNNTGAIIASQLQLDELVQAVTDAGTQLSGARFGAFFYNVINDAGESLLLYSLAGAPRSAFDKFGLPRNTPVFNATFRGQGVVRSADITKDSRYGTMAPHHGMPKGHLPVRSYLAAPVISRSGEVIGGLFFGHPDAEVFTERAERLIIGIAAQAAVAIDNARLYDAAQREIEKREKAEHALRESEERLRAAISATGSGTFRWNIPEATLEGDETLYRLFGLPANHGAVDLDVLMNRVHAEDRHQMAATVARCVNDAADINIEFRVVWPDGSVHWLSEMGRMYTGPEGQPSHMIGAAMEVTAQKTLNAEFEAARDAALEASRAKSTFLANMSHEFRTPLNAIIGYAELMHEQSDALGDELRADIAKILNAGQHLLSLISDILDLSKIEAGKMQVVISTFDVASVVNELAATVYPLLSKRSNRIVVQIAENIGTMASDETKLRQILFNLLSNAAKFTEMGQVTLTVHRLSQAGTDVISFRVEDTGIGMTPEEIKLLFRDFSQLDSSSTRRHGGTGLGLSISKRFSKMLSGDITVQSEKNQGSVFTLTVPAQLL